MIYLAWFIVLIVVVMVAVLFLVEVAPIINWNQVLGFLFVGMFIGSVIFLLNYYGLVP